MEVFKVLKKGNLTYFFLQNFDSFIYYEYLKISFLEKLKIERGFIKNSIFFLKIFSGCDFFGGQH